MLFYTSIKYCLFFNSLLRSFNKDHKSDFCEILEVLAFVWFNIVGCKKYILNFDIFVIFK